MAVMDKAAVTRELEQAIDDPFTPYGEKNQPVLDVRFKRVLKKLGKAQNVLEVGFGTGKLAMHLMAWGINVDMLDISEAYMPVFEEVASRRLGRKRGTDYQFIQHDIGATKGLPRHLKSKMIKRYDTVVACEVVEHIQEYRNAVSNMIACASKQVLLTTPYRNTFFSDDHKHSFEYEHFYFLGYQYTVERSFTKAADMPKKKMVLIIDIDVNDQKDSF